MLTTCAPRSAARCFGPGVVADEDGAERQKRVELVEGERLVQIDDPAAVQRVLRQLAPPGVAFRE